MDAYTFVDSMRQETIHALPIIVIPLMFLFVYGILEYLSARSYAKELEKRKYKRNLSINATEWTKSELERIDKQSCKTNNY